MNEHLLQAIESITQLILQKQRSLKSEESNPGYSSDDSDDKMKQLREELVKLRDVRHELELMIW